VATYQEIATGATCYECFGPISTAQAYQIYLLAQAVANATGNTAMTPQEIATGASCFACQGIKTGDAAIIYLLSQLVSAGGGGSGGGTCADYGGGNPSFTPSSGCGFAIDTSTGQVFWYYSGAWH
jgi:hypothetical protein